MRAVQLLSLLALASAPAFAQTAAPAPAPQAAPAQAAEGEAGATGAEPGRLNQRVERIRIEDGGSRVDEVRVGGQTQSITVQPKAGSTMVVGRTQKHGRRVCSRPAPVRRTLGWMCPAIT